MVHCCLLLFVMFMTSSSLRQVDVLLGYSSAAIRNAVFIGDSFELWYELLTEREICARWCGVDMA